MAAKRNGVATKRKTAPARQAPAKAKPKAQANNMGLGPLKGVYQERRKRLDKAIDAQTGYKRK